ncbi:MAG TPA: hypothetical protein PKO33_11755, partial [Pyrinomonadaceae bacterium]|nr:hypothetical protein [Pyrinomonadaceae bacterium]
VIFIPNYALKERLCPRIFANQRDQADRDRRHSVNAGKIQPIRVFPTSDLPVNPRKFGLIRENSWANSLARDSGSS